VVVTGEGSVGMTVLSILLLFVELPDDETLISGSGNEDLRILVFLLTVSGNDGGDPVGVTFEVTHEFKFGRL